MAELSDARAWFGLLTMTDRIALAALLVATLALVIAALAARYTRIQAKAAGRQDLRAIIQDMNRELIALRQLPSDVRLAVSTAKSTIDTYMSQIGSPTRERLGPPTHPYVGTAIANARKDKIARVPLLKEERSFLRDIVAYDDAVQHALAELHRTCGSESRTMPELHQALEHAKRAVDALETSGHAAGGIVHRVAPLADASIERLERGLR